MSAIQRTRQQGLQSDKVKYATNLNIKRHRIMCHWWNQQLFGSSNSLRSVMSVQNLLLSSCKHYVCRTVCKTTQKQLLESVFSLSWV